MFIEILANRTQVSDVAPGPLVIGGRENPDTLYNVFGERPPTFRKHTDKLSHTVTSVRAGLVPTRARVV